MNRTRVLFSPELEEWRFLPEGPRAFPGGFRYVNIQRDASGSAGDLITLSNDGRLLNSHRLPGRPGFWFPTSSPNCVLLGMDKEVGLYDLDLQTWTALARIPDENPRTIINDGEIVPGGKAIVFGTKDTRFADSISHLYLFTLADERLTVLAEGQLCSNGKVFASDDEGLLLYDIDTPRKAVTKYRFDLETRSIAELGIAVDLKHRSDFPDGMCDVGDGTVIIAFYNPAFAEHGLAGRFNLSKGELLEEWQTPGSPRVTCPLLLHRSDGVQLILTTATEGMPGELRQNCPNAGSLFVIDTAFPSIPPVQIAKLHSRT